MAPPSGAVGGTPTYLDGEIPLNQEDLAITLGIFGYLNLRSLRRLGIVLSQPDAEAYVHMWRYAGHVLGIAGELLPRSLADQEEFMLAAMLHQVGGWVGGWVELYLACALFLWIAIVQLYC